MKLSINIAQKIYSKKRQEEITRKFILLGIHQKYSTEKFLLFHTFSSIIIFIFGLLVFESTFFSIIITILYYLFLPVYYLDYRIKKRSQELEKEMILFLEVLSLSIQSGKNLISSIELAVEATDSQISKEFSQVLYEISYGKSFKESLLSLKSRIPSASINNIVINIIECYERGGDLSHILNQQVEYIREIRTYQVKEKINRLPIQISIISVVFMIPMILLLILGPALIRYFIG